MKIKFGHDLIDKAKSIHCYRILIGLCHETNLLRIVHLGLFIKIC